MQEGRGGAGGGRRGRLFFDRWKEQGGQVRSSVFSEGEVAIAEIFIPEPRIDKVKKKTIYPNKTITIINFFVQGLEGKDGSNLEMVGRPIYHEVSELMPPGQPKARRRRKREALEEEPEVGGARMTEAEAVRENLVSRSFEKKAMMPPTELIE